MAEHPRGGRPGPRRLRAGRQFVPATQMVRRSRCDVSPLAALWRDANFLFLARFAGRRKNRGLIFLHPHAARGGVHLPAACDEFKIEIMRRWIIILFLAVILMGFV